MKQEASNKAKGRYRCEFVQFVAEQDVLDRVVGEHHAHARLRARCGQLGQERKQLVHRCDARPACNHDCTSLHKSHALSCDHDRAPTRQEIRATTH